MQVQTALSARDCAVWRVRTPDMDEETGVILYRGRITNEKMDRPAEGMLYARHEVHNRL